MTLIFHHPMVDFQGMRKEKKIASQKRLAIVISQAG